jgi:hypothetical protein
MKRKLLTIVALPAMLLALMPVAYTQWSDTKNNFADSTHMAVSRALLTQGNSLVVRSYPDSGWFVIWQDTRDQATLGTDIYAQKYDKNGVALWAADGIPVVNHPATQYYRYAANFNHRNYSVAVTDSAGGFYIVYVEDSLANTSYQRIVVQNVLSDGSRLIGGSGFVVAATPSNQPSLNHAAPQLIADGWGGFYVSYIRRVIGSEEIYVNNYKKQGGTFVYNGGGYMNEYGTQQQQLGPCGLYNTVTYYGGRVYDYFIWPDGQGGCNVVMNLGLVGDKDVVGFNRVVRAKKACTTTIYRRTTDVANCDPYYSSYSAGDVAVLYRFRTYSYTMSCSSPGPPPVVYTQLSTQIETLGQGYLTLDNKGHDYYYVKGVTLNTAGNVNADLIAFNRRDLRTDFTITPISTLLSSRAIEKYDSLPYELCSNTTFCYTAIRNEPEGKILDKVGNLNDTILGPGALNFYDFSIAGSADKFFATALLWPAINREYSVYLQQLKLVQASADSFAVQYNTPADTGVLIGQNLSTGFGSNSISYDNPMVVTDQQGNGVFYIRDYYRHTRVSPIRNGYELAWGAMGKATGTGIFQTWPYRPENPFLLPDPNNGMGLLAWQDDRIPSGTFENIYMRRIDSLQVPGYVPPNKIVQGFFGGTTYGTPAFLAGTSKQYSVIDGYSSNSGHYGPIAEILDNVNLGSIEVTAYTHTTAIRMHNGKPYLNRNYTIKVQNNPGPATINLRLYFTTAEFDALKTADPTILTPGHLAVVKQAHNLSAAGATYTPVAGEETIAPISWSAVPGGYYIEIVVSGFSNFFVFKNENALPVTWVNVYANWENNSQAKVSWQIADEMNVKEYVVQHSKDGSSFKDVCKVTATGGTHYNCVVPGDNDTKNYYRVKEVDKDGNVSYSKVVLLSGNATDNLVSLYPNPASKVLNIQSGIELREITIVDGYGRNLFTYRGQNRIITLDITKYSKGIYTLVMIGKDGTKHYRKFMVE